MRFGPYELLEKVGEGAVGVVHRARAPDGRVVAIKIFRGAALARIERERRLLASLDEDGFVPLLDTGTAAGREFLVMPFLEGGTLRSRIEKGPLGVNETVALGRALARALGAAHAKGIVHRDVKPENVLFDGEGRPLIADLGLAKHFDSATPGASQSVALSKTGEFRGTAGYMPPEQMLDAKSTGPEGDVFALGAVLYECLAGEPAFFGQTVIEVVQKVEEGSFTPLAKRRKDVPAWLAGTIERCLVRAKEERFADGAALAAALEAKSDGRTRRRWWLAAPALVVVAAVGFLGWRARAGGSTAPVVSSPPPPAPGGTGSSNEARPELQPPSPLPDELRPGEKPGEYVHRKSSTVLVFVPGGRCRLGSETADPLARDSFETDLGPFWIGKYEVTNAEFARFVEATGHVTRAEKEGSSNHVVPQHTGMSRTPEQWHNQVTSEMAVDVYSWKKPFPDGKPAVDTFPVVCVSWFDAAAYAEWAGLVLPTEDQWEKAAAWDPVARRHLETTWGDAPRPGIHGSFRDASLYRVVGLAPSPIAADDGFPWAAPVGSFPDDRAPCGAIDMAGNVGEWCGDLHPAPNRLNSFIFAAAKVEPDQRVMRGANWTYAAEWVRLSERTVLPGGKTHGTMTGFRVAFVARKRRD
ncbi:MAG TPA: bifunctional serine/threonine-protein kinase/formylglycine-generating enzyme family protein [Planctomycetota bacterium]|nr:bifunctional serine/threonine-protein kinase/formylglycine-generating enzyme family protein [Planctomycetota bacterium]